MINFLLEDSFFRRFLPATCECSLNFQILKFELTNRIQQEDPFRQGIIKVFIIDTDFRRLNKPPVQLILIRV